MEKKEILEKYLKAGDVIKKVENEIKPKLKPGTKILDIAEEIEKNIRKLGAEPAFPVNISINETAAHYTPVPSDETIIKENDLVKIDLGCHVDGFIADRAFSFCSEKNEMIDVAKKALEEGIKMMKPGTKICEVSDVIEKTIIESVYKPVINLTGHNLDEYVFHGDIAIPSVKNNIDYELKDGDVFALEPFVTNGSGRVKEVETTLIFNFSDNKPVRLFEARKLLFLSKEKFSELPFCKRWVPEISQLKFDLATRQLVGTGALVGYPVLKEMDRNAKIAQAEHTIIVGDKPIVTT